MTIEKLNNNAVKITMESEEMLRYGVDIDKFNENDNETKCMITEILKNINDNTGMNLMNSKLFVEAFLSEKRRQCILYISVMNDNDNEVFEPYILYMIEFDSIRNFIGFRENVKNISESAIVQSSLYSNRGMLILIVRIISDYEESIVIPACEFGNIAGYGEICMAYAQEHFECISENNALKSVF